MGAPQTWRKGKGKIAVLRIGHRPQRDKRVTTHVCLTARALGADSVFLHEPDLRIVENVRSVVDRFGGPFEINPVDGWRAVLKDWKRDGGQVAHLTMYGLPLPEALPRLDADRDLLVVVGAEKVPFDVFEAADVNVAVGAQPHSEVAALAVLLDRLLGGSWENKPFTGKVRVVPSERAKEVSPRSDP